MKIKTCTRCGMHETSALIIFDEFDICQGCVSSEQKMKIQWSKREKNLVKIFNHYKKKTKNNYDCIIPINSTF